MPFVDIVGKVVGPVVAGLWSHLHLGRYLSFKLQEIKGQLHSYSDEDEFWKDIIGPMHHRGGNVRLRLGDIVELKNFQLTDWFPRAPGVFWTAEGFRRRGSANNHIEYQTNHHKVYTPNGKYFMVSGGIGTNRILAHQSPQGSYRILCATSSGVCDAGIPVVIPEDFCSRIEERLLEGKGIEVDLKGRLVSLPFHHNELALPARGSHLHDGLKDWLTSSLHVPRYLLIVESPLLIHKYISDHRLIASAWTLFATEGEDQVRPSFTYASFDPSNARSLQNAFAFLEDYVRKHGGNVIYTDCDEHVRRLDSKYSLNRILTEGVRAHQDFNKIFDWGENVQGVD
jgi:hypothetical protein